MNSEVGSNNPKLQSVNYVTILPSGKTSGYQENQQIDFKIDPVQFPYIDGKQSYLLLNITPQAEFSNVNATAEPPMVFPPNMGANSLINRLTCRLNDGTGKIIEDREAYNMYNGLMNSYQHDSEVFPSLARCEGVSGRTSDPVNRTIDNVNNTYFYPKPTISATNQATGGNRLITQTSFVVPIQLGLFSAFSNQHMAVPNVNLGGVNLTYYLEKANRCMQTLCHKFYTTRTKNGVAIHQVDAVEYTQLVNGEFTSATEFNVATNDCDPSLFVGDEAYTIDMCAWRVGVPLRINGTTDVSVITEIKLDAGLIKVTLADAIGTVGNAALLPDTIVNRGYTINKVELRVLNTTPDMPTMKEIQRSVGKGINYNSTQLYKISTASSLKNAVVDIPESLTKCMSIYAVPCQQSNLESLDSANSYIFPRPDSVLNSNSNDYAYQWQVKQVLIPNLEVETKKNVDVKSDNVIYFNQQMMAMRPMNKVRSLTDNKLSSTGSTLDLDLPYFFPLLLAPQGSSFDLIDSSPQLRITNTDTATTTAKLYHVFINHTRLIKGSDGNIEVEF